MRFIYTGIEVTDMEKALAFYRDVLGMKLEGRFGIEETGGEVAALVSEGSGQVLEVNHYPDGGLKGPPGLDHLAFEVDDADRAFEELLAKGCESAMEPFDEGSYRLAYVKDPDGNWIELSHRLD